MAQQGLVPTRLPGSPRHSWYPLPELSTTDCRQPTQAGPSSCLRSASSEADGRTRSLSSSRSTRGPGPAEQPQVHFRRTGVGAQHLPQPLHHRRHAPRPPGSTPRKGRCCPSVVSSGTLTSIATSLGTSSRRSSRPLTSTIASSMTRLHALLVGSGEEQHLDRALQVLQRGRGPGVALLGDLALDARTGSRRAVTTWPSARSPLGSARGSSSAEPSSWASEQSVAAASTCSMPEQRMVGDVQAEHLPLEAQQRCLVPSPYRARARRRSPLSRRSSPKSESWPIASLRLTSMIASTACSWIMHQALARVPERVERAGLDQRLDDPLVAHVDRDLAQEIGEAGEGALGGPRRDDRLHHAAPTLRTAAMPNRMSLPTGVNIAVDSVHVRGQHPDAHPAAFVQVQRGLVLVAGHRGEQAGHVLGRVVGLEVGGPVGDQPVAGRVRRLKA